MIMMRLILTLLVSFVPLANADYASCILENMKGVRSDVAAEEIKRACELNRNDAVLTQVEETNEISENPAEFAVCESKEEKEVLALLEDRERYFLSSDSRVTDEDAVNYIYKVSKPIFDRVGLDCGSWRIHIIEKPSADRFSFPDGQIYLSSGLLAQLTDTSQLRSVIVHEVSHVQLMNTETKLLSTDGLNKWKKAALRLLVSLSTDNEYADELVIGVVESPRVANAKENENATDSMEEKVLELQEQLLADVDGSRHEAFQEVNLLSGSRIGASEEAKRFKPRSLDERRHPYIRSIGSGLSTKDEAYLEAVSSVVPTVVKKWMNAGGSRGALTILDAYTEVGNSSINVNLLKALALQMLDDRPLVASEKDFKREAFKMALQAINGGRQLSFYRAEVGSKVKKKFQRVVEENHKAAIKLFETALNDETPEPIAYWGIAQSFLRLGENRLGAKFLLQYVKEFPMGYHRNNALEQLGELRGLL